MFISTFHSNNSTGLWALISGGGGEHSLMTSTRCPTPLTCSLQLIVVTPRRGGGGTGDGLRVRGRGAASVLGCYHYPAGGFHIIVVGEVLLFCTFLHFKISSSNYCHVLPHLTVPLSSFAKKCIFPD